jgi:glycosyltransferase involved in cell wall biosynthesis
VSRIAYLFPAFPVLHQTFTLGEVLGLKARGYDLRLVSLKASDAELQQDEARPLIEETAYCPRLLSRPILGSFFRALVARPGAVLALFGKVFAAWRTRASDDEDAGAAPPTTLTLAERCLAVYHHNAYVYLAKSLVLVPYAIYLSEVFEREGVSHVHAHWATYPTTVAYLIKEWSGRTYSFTAHAYDIYMISRMLPVKVGSASFVVTCADTNRRYLAGLSENGAAQRIHVNYHGSDLTRFAPMERLRGDSFRVMSCGWLKEYKGFHYLLDAVALLAGKGIDIQVDIAGDGPQRPYLEAKAAELGIADRLTLHGYLGHDDLIGLYRESDVFALPSIVMGRYGRQDVIPNVLAEAMAVGIPVVGTNVGGVAELIDSDVNGFVVPERDVAALAEALQTIWENPAKAADMAHAGREKVERIWDRDVNLGELARLIDEYVPNAHPGVAA